MPPPSPSLHSLLSSLRSPIFHTAHNPQNLRNGSKYLRKRLVGPSAIQYYPKTLNLRTLNADVAWNRYSGWEGDKIAAPVSEEKREGEEEGVQVVEEGGEGGGGGVKLANQGRMLPRGEQVPAGFSEVTRIRGAGWVDDARERTRREEVEIMRAMGRGPPKKGQGKRSQMKKR